MNKLYLVSVFGGVSSEMHSPYDTEDDRDAAAAEMIDDDDTAFRLDIADDGTPTITDYSNSEVENL